MGFGFRRPALTEEEQREILEGARAGFASDTRDLASGIRSALVDDTEADDSESPPVIELEPDVAETRFDLPATVPSADEPEPSLPVRAPEPARRAAPTGPRFVSGGTLMAPPRGAARIPTPPIAASPPSARDLRGGFPLAESPEDADSVAPPEGGASRVRPTLVDSEEEYVDEQGRDVTPPRAAPAAEEALPVAPAPAERSEGLSRPWSFGPTPEESQELAKAQRRDRRMTRASRALRGIGLGLGALGIEGGGPLFGLGTGLAMGSDAFGSPTERQDEVRARIGERLGAENAARQFDAQQSEMRQRAAESDLQRRGLESEIGLRNARAEAIQSEASSVDDAAAARESGSAGYRDYIRARVAAIPNSQTRRPLEDVVNSESFEGIQDPEQLDRILASVDAVDRRRGGGGVGGSGGSPRIRMVETESGAFVPQRVGGRRDPAETAPSEAPAPAAPAARRAHRGAPSGPVSGASPEAASIAPPSGADPIVMAVRAAMPNLDANESIIARAFVMRNGLDESDIRTPAGQAAIMAEVAAFHATSGREQGEMLSRAGGTFARTMQPNRVSEGIDEAAYRRAAAGPRSIGQAYEAGVRPFLQARHALRAAIQRYGARDPRVIAAIQGDARAGSLVGMPDLNRLVAEMRQQYGRGLSGAAITPEEWADFEQILGTGSIFTSPEVALNKINDLVSTGESLMRRRAVDAGDIRFADEWWRLHRLSLQESRRARGSGGSR